MNLIGLSGNQMQITEELDGTSIGRNYTDGLLKAGAMPVLIPAGYDSKAIDELCDRIDGLLLTGGEDVDPSFFGEEPLQFLGTVNPERDDLEFKLVHQMISRKKPVFGICRGLQMMNVIMGGTLYQDIPKQVRKAIMHRQKAVRWHLSHLVSIEGKTNLADILQAKEIRVNSFHHQAIKEVAPGFIVSARSSDGIIEAIEHPKYPFLLGVQWHPENLWSRHPLFLKLFEAFVEACNAPSAET